MENIKILSFGSLTEFMKSDFIALENVKDTDELYVMLLKKYPQLKEKAFVISIDQKIISENTPITSSSEIAILPPFSGG
jgi:molybdopterin synthase sulfur carrier subunit